MGDEDRPARRQGALPDREEPAHGRQRSGRAQPDRRAHAAERRGQEEDRPAARHDRGADHRQGQRHRRQSAALGRAEPREGGPERRDLDSDQERRHQRRHGAVPVHQQALQEQGRLDGRSPGRPGDVRGGQRGRGSRDGQAPDRSGRLSQEGAPDQARAGARPVAARRREPEGSGADAPDPAPAERAQAGQLRRRRHRRVQGADAGRQAARLERSEARRAARARGGAGRVDDRAARAPRRGRPRGAHEERGYRRRAAPGRHGPGAVRRRTRRGSHRVPDRTVTAFSEIRYEVEDGVCTVTLSRPDRLNAATTTMLRELGEARDRADAADAVRAGIEDGARSGLGAGGATFGDSSRASAGGAPAPRRPAARKANASADDHRDGGGKVTLRIFDMKKPVIAAINGPAVGFGITLTLPMDIRIASSAARIGFVFARRGVVPEACSTWFLPRLVGMSQAAEWVYTGRVFTAEEALAGRLVSRVVAPDALLPAARALAREIADNTSAVSVTLARQMMWKLLGADHPMDAHRLDSQAMFWTGRSADAREGIAAFLEKRPARFPLRPSADLPPFYPWWRPRPFAPPRD